MTEARRPKTARWIAALCSAGAAAAVGWFVLVPRFEEKQADQPGLGVEAVEVGMGVEKLFRQRAAEVDPPVSSDPLLRVPMDEELVRKLFPIIRGKAFEYHPQRTFIRVANYENGIHWPEHERGGWLNKTNSYGMRADADPGDPAPRWRVLITGDSHTEGACGNDESFPYLLDRRLVGLGYDAEVWNAGCGVYSFYEYLGALEHLLELEPDVFIVTVYGGNDFYGAMRSQRYFHRRLAPQRAWKPVREYHEAGGLTPADVFHQDLSQVVYFRRNPEDVELSVETGLAVLREMAAICEREGVEFGVAYLPPASTAQPKLYGPIYEDAVEAFEFTLDELFLSDRLADELLAGLTEAGIRCVDLRPGYRASTEWLYWVTDMHINLAGHREVARALEPLLVEFLQKAE